ncbi:MAG: DUF3047 domain-containing protein [Rubrivivax sp.]|nr:DUF3047 domain-containing protein [Rubrivivax sp.]MDH5338865.1 DUF3047 domain-containing protein [Rubrivivax sp.]
MTLAHRVALLGLLACSLPAGAAAPCEPVDLAFDKPAAGWAHLPLSRLKRDTAYTVEQEGGRNVLRASAERSASLYVARLAAPMPAPATLSWSWKTDALVPGADNGDSKREDAPLRVLAAFGGDPKTLPEDEQRRMTRAERLSGRSPPFATLMYIWGDKVAAGSITPSAHTGQLKMLAVAAGADGLGRWHTVQRDVAADYRRAFGAEPGPLLGVAVMTDTDNTDTKAVGLYADIRLGCAGN